MLTVSSAFAPCRAPALSCRPFRLHIKYRISCSNARRYTVQASSSGVGSDPDPSPASTSSASSSGSPGTYAIPAGIPTAGAVFVLAGFLKLMIMCFPFSTMAISMYLQGRADLGVWAVFKMLPFALGILALAKYLVDNRDLVSKKWFHRAVALGGLAALLLSRLVFARPRPSPLDPLIRATQEARVAQVAALEQRQEAARQRGERSGLKQPGEDVRQQLQRRGSRFE